MATCSAEQDLSYVAEGWGILPRSLSHVDNVFGQKLFSSEAVKEKFINAISNQDILSPVKDKIRNLIERQIIVPAFVSKNVIRLIGHKFFSDQFEKLVLGFYDSSKNKIYILLDNNTKFLFFMSNKALGLLTMHELQHYASLNLKFKFANLHKNTFRTYFRNFYKMYADVNLPDSIIDDIVIFIFKNFEYPKNQSTQFLVKYADIIYDSFHQYIKDDDQREYIIRDMMSVLKLYLTDANSFIASIRGGNDKVIKLVKSLSQSYKSLKIRNPRSLPIQELIFPSEIIAIESQFRPNDNHYAAIKAL